MWGCDFFSKGKGSISSGQIFNKKLLGKLNNHVIRHNMTFEFNDFQVCDVNFGNYSILLYFCVHNINIRNFPSVVSLLTF